MLHYAKFCGKVKILLPTKRSLCSLSAVAFPKRGSLPHGRDSNHDVFKQPVVLFLTV